MSLGTFGLLEMELYLMGMQEWLTQEKGLLERSLLNLESVLFSRSQCLKFSNLNFVRCKLFIKKHIKKYKY